MKLSKVLFRNLSQLMDSFAAEKWTHYANFFPSPVSIRHFLQHGQSANIETSYLFLRKEIPVRLANMMKELELLPEELQRQAPVCQIQDHYVQSFQDMLKFESSENNSGNHEAFASTLKSIRLRHLDTVPLMANALQSLKKSHQIPLTVNQSIQYFLNRLYTSRISIHMLIHHHGLLFGPSSEPKQDPRHVGCIDPHCDVAEMVRLAYEEASFLAQQTYSVTAPLQLQVFNSIEEEKPITFSYVPSHLHYILFEILKNGLRASIEKAGDSYSIPSISVLIVKSPSDVTIKISDEGGGIPRVSTEQLFTYLYSTAVHNSQEGISPLAGLGHGLPLSRLYARYFHGDLLLNSVDGYGTDVSIYLRTLCEEAAEILPVFNARVRQSYNKRQPLSNDWTDPSAILNHGQSKGVRDSSMSYIDGK